jgi:hypothetical protein
MTEDDKNIIQSKLNLVLEDFQMLRDGIWIPDETTCDASIENLINVIHIIENE